MSANTVAITDPLSAKSDPPLRVCGRAADHLYAMILDQTRCHSCAIEITRKDEWGVVADVSERDGKAVIEAVRRCAACWSYPAQAMKQLGRAWE